MLKLLTAPVTNDRGPRYMERALAAIHQANREPMSLIDAAKEGRVGMFVRFAGHAEELVCSPIAANYANCSLATVEAFDDASPGWKTSYADLELTPEIFPILRHAQFEDLLNGTFADPVSDAAQFAAMSTPECWDAPGMELYDDYDAHKPKS